MKLNSTLQHLLPALRPRVRHRVWICSDLQQWDPAAAERILDTVFADFHSLELPCEQVWNLGDTTDGKDPARMRETVLLQAERFESLGVPLVYACGNHDFDFFKKNTSAGAEAVPAWKLLQVRPAWRTTRRLEDFHFAFDMGDYRVFVFGDHGAEDGRWIVTHGKTHGVAEAYPHTPEAYDAVRRTMAEHAGPVISLGHYAYPGGNRPSPLMGRLLPLPENVRVHFYGHAHLGESRLLGEHNFRKIAYVDHQHVPQLDVAALEDRKGTRLRSVFLEMYHDGAFGVFFRNHTEKTWEEALFLDPHRRP